MPRLAVTLCWCGVPHSETGLTPQDRGVANLSTPSQYLIMEVAATVDDKVIETAGDCAEQVTKLPFEPLDEETCPGTDVCSDPPSVRKYVDPFVGAFLSQYWPVSGSMCFQRNPLMQRFRVTAQ